MNGKKSYADQENEEFYGEGSKAVLEEGELTLEELENVGSSGNYKELLDLLTYEQLQYVKNSSLLTLPEQEAREILEKMVAENKKRIMLTLRQNSIKKLEEFTREFSEKNGIDLTKSDFVEYLLNTYGKDEK